MNDDTATDVPQAAPAVGARLEPGVGRLEPERLGARVWAATRRLLCPHTHGRLVAIEFDGEAVYRCTGCGKHIGKLL